MERIDVAGTDSLKVLGVSLGNYALSLTTLSLALQCIVAVMSIVYLGYKIKKIRSE